MQLCAIFSVHLSLQMLHVSSFAAGVLFSVFWLQVSVFSSQFCLKLAFDVVLMWLATMPLTVMDCQLLNFHTFDSLYECQKIIRRKPKRGIKNEVAFNMKTQI